MKINVSNRRRKKLRIAQIAPLNSAVEPDPRYATTGIIYYLTEGLRKKGHEVTLFASGDSQTSAKLVALTPSVVNEKDLSEKQKQKGYRAYLYNFALAARAYRQWQEFDIIHIHLGNNGQVEGLFFSDLAPVPTIASVQCMFDELMPEIVQSFQKKVTFVALSKDHLEKAQPLKSKTFIYNGIDVNKFSYGKDPSDYLLFLSRLHPNKGALTAVKVAKKLRLPIKVAGHRSTSRPEYYQAILKEKGRRAELISEVDLPTKIKLYQRAKALIFPVQIDEPFGLVMIEAMACGTPVVAFGRGSVPEIVEDGKTGFVVKPGDLAGLAKAVKKIYEMPQKDYLALRQRCRKRVEEKFSIGRMVDHYEELYLKVRGEK